jgi:hypothetical protein
MEYAEDSKSRSDRWAMFQKQLSRTNVAEASGVQWAYTVFRNMVAQLPMCDPAALSNSFGSILIKADGGAVDEFEAAHLVTVVCDLLREHGSPVEEMELYQKQTILVDGLVDGQNADSFVTAFLPLIYLGVRRLQAGRQQFENFTEAVRR